MQTSSNMRKLIRSQLLLCGAAILVAALPVKAEFQIEDAKHVLEDLSHRVDPVPFETAMTCGQDTLFSATKDNCEIKCNQNFCSSKCSGPTAGSLTFHLVTEECSESSVAVYGSNGFSATLTKEDYVKGGNTWLLGLLKNLGTYLQPEGKLILRGVWMQSFKEVKNGEQSSFLGEMIDADLEILPGTENLHVEIGIDPHAQGLNQIAILRLNDDDVFLKRKGILSVGP